MTESEIKSHKNGDGRKDEELMSVIKSTIDEIKANFLPTEG